MRSPQRIKVLHVAPLPPPLGGMVTYIQGLLNSDVFKEIDYKVVRFSYFNKERYKGFGRTIINLLNSFVLTINFLVKSYSWHPNIVHIQSSSGFGFFEKSWIALLAKISGYHTLFHFHGGNLRNFYLNSSEFKRKFIRKCAMINDQIITGSPQMLESWLFIGIPNEKITYIGNAVDLPSIPPKKDKSEVTILFLTRIVKEKGVFELIDAFLQFQSIYNNLELRIVGAESLDSPSVEEYIKTVNMEGTIKFIGSVTEEQKRNEYLNADIFAFPTYFEDQSYAIMEAMSYELPCVASNVGGVPSLISDGENGLLIIPQDVNSLHAALERLIQDPKLRKDLGRNARLTIENGFTWEIRSKEIVKLYQRTIYNREN